MELSITRWDGYRGRHTKTKQQNEVTGPRAKIDAQTGTDNARDASRKATI